MNAPAECFFQGSSNLLSFFNLIVEISYSGEMSVQTHISDERKQTIFFAIKFIEQSTFNCGEKVTLAPRLSLAGKNNTRRRLNLSIGSATNGIVQCLLVDSTSRAVDDKNPVFLLDCTNENKADNSWLWFVRKIKLYSARRE